jgi:hypothetical protein
MIAAASLGDHETANKCSEQYQEIVFPYLAKNRENHEKATKEILEKLRGFEIKVRRADWKLSDLRSMNSSIVR